MCTHKQEAQLTDKAAQTKEVSAVKAESKSIQTPPSPAWIPASTKKDEMESIKIMVSKTAAFLENNGQWATFKEVDDPSGIFAADNLFVYIINEDRNGKVVASRDKSLLNKNIKTKDDEGKSFIKGILKQARESDSGYITYKWNNKTRSCYFEKFKKFIIVGSN